MIHANEVAPDHNATTDLNACSATALRFADRRSTDRLHTGSISRADRGAFYFGWSRVFGCRVFQL